MLFHFPVPDENIEKWRNYYLDFFPLLGKYFEQIEQSVRLSKEKDSIFYD